MFFRNLTGMCADGPVKVESARTHAGTLSGATAGTTSLPAVPFTFAGVQPIAAAIAAAAKQQNDLFNQSPNIRRSRSGREVALPPQFSSVLLAGIGLARTPCR